MGMPPMNTLHNLHCKWVEIEGVKLID
jgi:hypothetical protein